MERFRGLLTTLRHPVVAVALGMIALQLVYRAWAVYTGYFYTDDYLLLLDARRDGLTADYLMSPYNSHVMPGSRALIWLVGTSGSLNWGLAATMTLVVQAVASLAALWMLVTLFGKRWAVLAPLALYLTSAITAQATMWWISSLNQITVQLAFFLAVGAWVVYLRTRSLAWLVGSGASVALGLLFFQKTLLVLPVLVFLAAVYFAAGGPVQRFRHLVRAYWPALLVMGAVAGGYGVYSVLQVRQPFTDSKSVNVLELTWHMVGSAVVGALGGPWRWQWQPGGSWADTPSWVVVVAVVVTLLLAAYSIVHRVRAFWAWLLLLGYLLMEVLLVATSRAPVFGSEIGLSYRLQTDAICALVLCLGLAVLPLLGAVQSSEPRQPVSWPRPQHRLPDRVLARPVGTPWLVGAVALVSLSGLLCWTTYAVSWHDNNASQPYLRTMDGELRRQGTTTLADWPVPDGVLPEAFFAPDHNLVSTLAPLLGRSIEFPAASSNLAVVGRNGTLHRAMITPSTSSKPGPHPNCGWLGGAPRMKIPLKSSTLDLDWWVRIGYLSTHADSVVVRLGDDRVETRISKGLGNLYVRTSGEFDSVTISDLSPDTQLCVDVVEVGTLTEGPGL
jgi:hypothetical protein